MKFPYLMRRAFKHHRPSAATSFLRNAGRPGIEGLAIGTFRTYRRVFGIESIVWGAFAAVQLATGVPFTIALVSWSVWYATRAFERSTEWDDADASEDARALLL
jgi:hypothetical protein